MWVDCAKFKRLNFAILVISFMVFHRGGPRVGDACSGESEDQYSGTSAARASCGRPARSAYGEGSGRVSTRLSAGYVFMSAGYVYIYMCMRSAVCKMAAH